MKIKEICTSITDGSHNPPQGISRSEYMMLSSKNIFDDSITLDDPRFLDKSDFAQEDKRTRIMSGDVLLTIVGTVGRCAVVPEMFPRFTLQRSVAVLHPKMDICSSRFLMYALRGKRSYIEARAKGVAQKGIYLGEVAEIDVNVPTMDEQEAIIIRMDSVVSIINKRRQQLAALDNLIKARFVEMFGDMLINPKGLPEKRLDSLADIVSGITKGRKAKTDELYEVPYMAVSNVKDGYIDWTTVKTIMATAGEIDQYRLLPDDVLMTEGGDPDKLGRGAIIHEPPQDCIHQNHIFRVRLMKDVLLSVYMAQYLQQQKAKRYFLGCAKQTTGIASINMRQLSALPVLVPPMKEQEDYAAFVAHVDKSKSVIQKALEETQLLFNRMMQQYFG